MLTKKISSLLALIMVVLLVFPPRASALEPAQTGTNQNLGPKTYELDGLALTTIPIIAPLSIKYPDGNLRNCTFTTAMLRKLDNSVFQTSDVYRIETSLEENSYTKNLAFQLDGSIGVKNPPNRNGLGSSILGIRIQLCEEEIRQFKPKYLRLKLTKLTSEQKMVGEVPVVYPENVASVVVENQKTVCAVGPYSKNPLFGNQVVFHSISSREFLDNRKRNTVHTLKGHLFRNGILAANEELVFFLTNRDSTMRVLGMTKTDSMGGFETNFQLNYLNPSIRPSGHPKISILLSERGLPLGEINDPFSAELLERDFEWANNTQLRLLSENWIPRQTAACNSALAQGYSSGDERQPLAWFVVKELYNLYQANKYKTNQSQTKSIDPKASTKAKPDSKSTKNKVSIGKCWVSGYTTKTGKRVNGYFRKC